MTYDWDAVAALASLGSPTADEVKGVRVDWTLRPGEAVSRSDVHDRYGGVRQGGISPSSTSPNVLLFTDDAANRQHGYLRDH